MSEGSAGPIQSGCPVQLEVSYRSTNALVTAYTASLSKGGFVFLSDKPLVAGARFDFHLRVDNDPNPVTLLGLVVRSTAVGARHQVAVQYLPTPSSRAPLGRLLGQLHANLSSSVVRVEPRIPVNLIARDVLLITRTFVIENLSHGGMGVSLTRGSELSQLAVSTPCGLEVRLHERAAMVLRGTVVWIHRGIRSSGARFGVKFLGLCEAEHLLIAGMMQLFRPQALFLAVSEECIALLSSASGRPAVRFDPEELTGILCSVLARSLSELSSLPCSAFPSTLEAEPLVGSWLKFRTGLAGDVDIELTLFAERSCIEMLAREAGYEQVELDVCDSGLELLTMLAGHMADQLEALNLREEVLPHRAAEPLSARRPFDRLVLLDVRVGAQTMLLEVLLRLQTLSESLIAHVASEAAAQGTPMT